MKSYFAHSVQAAMEQARKELGADAVLVMTRAAPAEVRQMGEHEVVFATDVPVAAGQGGTDSASSVQSPPTGPVLDSVLQEVRELQKEFHAFRLTSIRSSGEPSWMAGQPEAAAYFESLTAAEVDRELAVQILTTAQRKVREGAGEALPDSRRLWMAIREVLAGLFSVDSTLGATAEEPRVVALVGPPGAGKTAMLARLAVRYGLPGRKPMQFLSLDTLRVAACDQLRTYAAILGVGFQVVENNHALGQAIREHQSKELILIDTPGLARADLEGGHDMPEYFARRDDIQKHLVLPASLRAIDLTRVAAGYRAFQPTRLIFTRMDETDAFGPILGLAAELALPISFFGTGQKVPEDLEVATMAALLDRLLPTPQPEKASRTAA